MRSITTLIFFLGICSLVYGQNQQLKSYDKLCEIFNEKYASFEEKRIDWPQRCAEFRVNIDANTSEDELFEIMTKLLKPLNDGHITLRAKNIDSAFSASRPSRIMTEIASIEKKKRKKQFNAMVENTLMLNGFEPRKELGPAFRSEKLFRYTKSDKVGYVQFYRSFSKLLWMNGPFLNSQLNTIFNSFEDMDAIIIDIRFNIGGDDGFSQKIAGRFISDEGVGFYKQTRKNGNFGSLQSKIIKPMGKKPFLKPVILLTNDQTFSAADVLALMMSELPNATIIGEPSNGSYSDLKNAKLPNGWNLTLSHQRYLSVSKNNYEGLGTPVDIEVRNMLEDIETGEDSVLKAALEFIEK
jgi:C-terminal processing protease CtpA/Prc